MCLCARVEGGQEEKEEVKKEEEEEEEWEEENRENELHHCFGAFVRQALEEKWLNLMLEPTDFPVTTSLKSLKYGC